MKFKKLKVSKDSTIRLKMLKGKTGLTPNLLCRLAFCHSLQDPRIPDLEQYDTEGQEFNRYTLTGDLDSAFEALLRERCLQDGITDEEEQEAQFLAHINRGVFHLSSKVKSPSDIVDLIPRQEVPA